MKRKVTSLLLCFIMLFSVMSVAVPAYAAPVTSTALTVSADKATAAPGETITYTVTMGPVSDLGSIQMVLDIPSGLTYVSGSGSLAAGLKAKLGFDSVDYTEGTKEGKPRIMINGVASAANYESATDTVIATFKCTVAAGATGTLEVGLTELEFYSVDLTDNTSRFSVVTAKVTVNAPTVTTYTVSFNANGGTGAMADVTGVAAGAYTLPANGFTAPDGKRFVGWATSATGSVITTATYNVTENVTFYAIWEEIPTSHPAKPTLGITGTYTYNGSAQTVTVTGFDSATMLITGNVGTNADTYTASVTSKSGRWADGTSTPVTIEWSIGRKTVTPVIRVTGTYTYTGTPVEPTFTVEDGGVVISSSEYKRTFTDNDAVGTGKITVSDKPDGNYEILTTSQTFEITAPTPVYTSTEIKITADKTDAKAGDEITFTITMGPVSELGSIQMKLKLPAGLTVVAGSCQLAAGLKATLGFDDISFTEGTEYVITGVASAANYRSDADTVIATFKCKVDTSAPGNLKADLKELEFYSVDLIDNTSRFSVVPATITVADGRTKVSEVAGTSDIATIPVYGGAFNKPTVTVTTGAPAYFNINSGNGRWLKKNSAGIWEKYTGATFTEGTYKFDCQVRIDGAAGLTHVLDSAGVTVTVDGVAWTTGTPDVYDHYSLVGVTSPEYTVTAPAGTPLAFAKNDAWNIGNTQSGMAIASFSVASGASGGTAPYTFSKVSGPAWLAVAPDGTVSGTPTAAGANENLVIRVTDSAGTPATADITLTVGNTAVNPADRTKVNKVEGNSDIATIPVYGGAYKKPTVNVTTGAPAFFTINSGNGDWLKKNSAGVWERYTGATFTEGTYKFQCQVRIDGAAGLTHVFDSAGVTVTVDGVAWTAGTPDVENHYSLVWVQSPEYTVTKPATTTYTVSFNANGGTGTMADVTGVAAGAYTLPANGFTAPAGKQFKGWATSATGEVIATATYNVTGNVTFYAIWENIPVTTYTVSFNANGGTGTMAAVTGVTAGEYTLPANGFTAPAGKQFKGWATSATGEVIATATYNVTGNVTFYAIWENIPVTTYTVSFNANGGTGTMADVTGVAAGEYTLPANGFTAPAGKQFKGWATSATGEVIATATYNVTGNVTFYAIWENIYTITFGANGGTGEMAAVTGVAAGEYTLPANGFTAPSCKKFKGWATSENGEVIATATYNVTGNVTFYAIWEDDPAAHNYGTEWYKNSEKHWHECAVCHTKKDEAPHVYDNDCDTTCNVCGAVREITHNYAEVWSNDENNHWHECTVCHTRKDEAPHVYDNDCDTTCNVCGAVREVTHNYAEVWSNDENNHWHECTVCHTRKDEAAHVPGPEATEETAQVCTVCGYVLKAPLGHTHKPKLVEKVEPTCTENGNIAYYKCHCGKLYYDSAATREITDLSKIVLFSKGHVRCHEWHTTVLYHWQECTVCNERIDTAFHRPGADATETTPQTCPVCGYVLKEALGHTHKFDQKNTDAKYLKSAANCNSGAVYYYSCACGEKGTETFVSGEKLNHTFKTEWSTDENNHWHECSLCGTVKDKAAHTFEWLIDKKPTAGEAGAKHERCSVCGYKKDAVIIEPTGTTTTTPPAVTTTEGKAETPEKSGAAWVWAIVAVVVLGGGAAVVIVLVRKKKKA